MFGRVFFQKDQVLLLHSTHQFVPQAIQKNHQQRLQLVATFAVAQANCCHGLLESVGSFPVTVALQVHARMEIKRSKQTGLLIKLGGDAVVYAFQSSQTLIWIGGRNKGPEQPCKN
jgi:hypothetical protein